MSRQNIWTRLSERNPHSSKSLLKKVQKVREDLKLKYTSDTIKLVSENQIVMNSYPSTIGMISKT